MSQVEKSTLSMRLPTAKRITNKASKDQFVNTANHVNEIGKVEEMLKNYTFGERYEWVEKTKSIGNEFYKQKVANCINI